jgi:hypothetical protein
MHNSGNTMHYGQGGWVNLQANGMGSRALGTGAHTQLGRVVSLFPPLSYMLVGVGLHLPACARGGGAD